MNQWLVAGGAVEGEGDLVVAFDCDGVGKFDDDLGEWEGWDGEDRFDDEGIDVMLAVFELDLDGGGRLAGQEIDAGGEEHDARALIGTEVEDVSQ